MQTDSTGDGVATSTMLVTAKTGHQAEPGSKSTGSTPMSDERTAGAEPGDRDGLFAGVVEQVVGLQSEGVFRKIVGFL